MWWAWEAEQRAGGYYFLGRDGVVEGWRGAHTADVSTGSTSV